jgi:hypothetical protein
MPANNMSVCVATSPGPSPRSTPTPPARNPSASAPERPEHHTSTAPAPDPAAGPGPATSPIGRCRAAMLPDGPDPGRAEKAIAPSAVVTPGLDRVRERPDRAARIDVLLASALAGQRVCHPFDDGAQIIAAGRTAERARTIGRQSAHHGRTSRRYRAGLGQAAGQRGQQRSGLANSFQAERDARRTGGGRLGRHDGRRLPRRQDALQARSQVPAEISGRQLDRARPG